MAALLGVPFPFGRSVNVTWSFCSYSNSSVSWLDFEDVCAFADEILVRSSILSNLIDMALSLLNIPAGLPLFVQRWTC